MKERRFVSSQKTLPRPISGKSVIDHKIRHKLKLTCDEYVLIDFVKEFQERKPGEKMSYSYLWEKIGYNKDAIIDAWNSLKEKQLVSKDEQTGLVIISPDWLKQFATIEDFDRIWEVYGTIEQGGNKIAVGEKGNKQKAKDMYLKAIKVIDVDTLIKAAKMYTEHCYKNGTYIKNCSSWLNPKYMYWNDALELIKKAEQPKEKVTIIDNFMHGAKT